MNEMTVGGLIGIFAAAPGIAIGVAMLLGKWRPASRVEGVDPDVVRVAAARLLLLVNGAILALSLALVALPEAAIRPLVMYAVGGIVALTGVGLVFVLRAVRPAR